MALSSPDRRLRGPHGELLRSRPFCLACGCVLSAYRASCDRLCWQCSYEAKRALRVWLRSSRTLDQLPGTVLALLDELDELDDWSARA